MHCTGICPRDGVGHVAPRWSPAVCARRLEACVCQVNKFEGEFVGFKV